MCVLAVEFRFRHGTTPLLPAATPVPAADGEGASRPLELQSDLWLDQPDAHERIDERLALGRVTAAEVALLHGFVDDGYLKFPIDLDEGFCAGFDADVAGLWDERPGDLAVSP